MMTRKRLFHAFVLAWLALPMATIGLAYSTSLPGVSDDDASVLWGGLPCNSK